MKSYALAVLCLFSSSHSFAKIWHVGTARTYTKPSQVAGLVGNGDTVLIDAGTYDNDVCAWNKDNLLLKGSGGMAHLRANGTTYGGKAIWVIQGKNNRVDSVEFSLAACVDWNGAGIRQEGSGLTVRHCYFHDNENGILCGADTTSDMLIEYCEFYNNGHGDGYSHNLYIGHINTLTFQYNYSHHAKIGHELKSRAKTNYILYNRFDDEADGTASRSIDLPNGGRAIVMGNEIIKGPQSQNSNFMEFGLEGLTNTGPHNFYVVHNTFVNKRSSSIFIALPAGVSLMKIRNNILSGGGTFTFNSPASLDSGNNIFGTIAALKFNGTLNMEYQITGASPAINKGTNAGMAGSFSLVPAYAYVHPFSKSARTMYGAPDAGAQEYVDPAGLPGNEKEVLDFYPNPAVKEIHIKIPDSGKLILYNNIGSVLKIWYFMTPMDDQILDISDLSAGVYLLSMEGRTGISEKLLQIVD